MSKEDEIAEYDVDKMKKKSRKNKIITSCVVGVLVVGLALGLGLGLGLKRTKPEEFYLQATSNGQELVVDDERYDTNQQITLEAKEIDGYDFAYWNFNGMQIEENPYTFTLTDSSFGTYTAVYVEKTLEAEHLYATSNGQQLVIDEEIYQLGQQITIEASTIAGFEFSHWVFNESEITENPYTFNLTAENTGTYTAVYEEVELSLTYVVDGVSTRVSATEGQTIGDLLPSEITDENSIGWFVDENFKTTANVLDEITRPVTIHTKMATLEKLEIGQFALDSMLPVEQQDTRWYVRINDVSTSGDVVIPKAYGGEAVTAIYGQGFANSNISKIYIPDTITYMGDQAFYASAVSEVNFVGES